MLDLVDENGNPFSFVMTDKILRMREEVARRAGVSYATEPHGLKSADKGRYIVRSLMEESITSSQLEGASTSRKVAVEMLDTGRRPVSKSEIMIANSYQAMKWVKDASDKPITPDEIFELHRILTDDPLEDPADAGRLETPEHHRVAVWDNSGGVKLHDHPPALQLPERLEPLCNFAHADGKHGTYMPPVVRAIIIHFMFGYDHYFVDGNGRTARTMFYWSMLSADYWLCEYLTISKLLRKEPSEYSRAYIYCEDDDSDLTYFIHYQLEILLRALDELEEIIRLKQAESRQVTQILVNDPDIDLSYRQTDILRRLAEEEIGTIAATAYAQRYRASDQTARNDLGALVRQKFLLQHRHGRSHVWRASPSLVATITSVATGSHNAKTDG